MTGVFECITGRDFVIGDRRREAQRLLRPNQSGGKVSTERDPSKEAKRREFPILHPHSFEHRHVPQLKTRASLLAPKGRKTGRIQAQKKPRMGLF